MYYNIDDPYEEVGEMNWIDQVTIEYNENEALCDLVNFKAAD